MLNQKESVIGPMNNCGAVTRNRHRPGLARRDSGFDWTGACSGGARRQAQAEFDAIGAENRYPF
jgi:hypothetical protein